MPLPVKPLDPVSDALDRMASGNLTDAQARILLRIHHGFTSPSGIAKELGVSAATTCQSCKTLWKRKLLTKHHDPHDTRRVSYLLSKTGQAAVATLLPPAADDQA